MATSNLYLTVFLRQTFLEQGMLRPVPAETSPIAPVPAPVTTNTPGRITGVTGSRLDEVKTTSIAEPFIVGVNGVIDINDESISYLLDGIRYVTNLGDESTVYEIGFNTLPGLNPLNAGNIALYRNENDIFVDMHPTESDVFVERGEFSVLEHLYQLARVRELNDVELFF